MASNAGNAPGNPLISNQSSELQAVLHPLVLLSISDYITRHTLREQEGPIVGGLMGQHNGREVTIEHAFDCHVVGDPDTPYQYRLHMQNVQDRIEQMRAVHKDRNLDFVGWYTLLPVTGPSHELVSFHTDILTNVNESAILLGFHPQEVLQHSVGGKLPLTVYESNYEVDEASKAAAGSGDDDDPEGDKKMSETGEMSLMLRFREIAYTVETDEAEMISMDFVARGSGSATAAEPPRQEQKPAAIAHGHGHGKGEASSKWKGKDKALTPAEHPEDITDDNVTLSNEEEEMIASLTAKANATKMLHSRIELLINYLERLPPAFVSGEDVAAQPENDEQTVPSNTILRQIQALVARLELIEPSDVEAFRGEVLREQNDVHLVSLLNDVMRSVRDVRDMGRKFEIVDGSKARDQRNRMPWDAPSGGKGSGGFSIQGTGDLLM